MSSLRAYFDGTKHRPSEAHWSALQDITETMEDMANRTCPAEVRLSSIDPGVGKTQAVVHFARVLANSDDHQHVGMVVCVGRITEAERLAADLSEIRDRFAVLVREGEPANSLGRAEPADAQVLITTQQRVDRATDGRGFSEVTSLFYRGAPRQVRCWDESWQPGVTVELASDALGFLLEPARRLSPRLREEIAGLMHRLDAAQTGDLMDIPDFEQNHGITVHDMVDAIPGGDGRLRDDQHAAAKALFLLAGRAARVWRDNRDGSAIITYQDTMPDDIKPLLVLDASGRVRRTYVDLERHRGLRRLRHATKNYAPLTIHVWRRGGGKTSFKEAGAEITKGVVETIMMKPRERWLVVAHKSGNGIRDMARDLQRALPPDVGANVSTITWGNHMASNLYAETPNVILAGTLFMREGHYVALTHMAQGRPTAPGFAPEDDIEQTRLGERAHYVLQALCRGRVRKLDGDRCLPMSAYVIASTRCIVPGFDGAFFSWEWKDALWARFSTAAPRRQRQSVERYNIVKRA